MAETRTPEEIRARSRPTARSSGSRSSACAARSREPTDWRGQLARTSKQVLIGAAVAGFVLGGGIAAFDRPAHRPPPQTASF